MWLYGTGAAMPDPHIITGQGSYRVETYIPPPGGAILDDKSCPPGILVRALWWVLGILERE